MRKTRFIILSLVESIHVLPPAPAAPLQVDADCPFEWNGLSEASLQLVFLISSEGISRISILTKTTVLFDDIKSEML